jgi:hypothetical protein
MGTIRLAQERLYAETGRGYADISPSLEHTYPAAKPGPFKTAWGADCGSQCNPGARWTDLPLKIVEPQAFGYATTAGLAGPTHPTSISINGASMDLGSRPEAWYIVAAVGDTDGDGSFARLYTFSWDTRIFVENEED